MHLFRPEILIAFLVAPLPVVSASSADSPMNAVPFKIGKQESADSADIGGPRERQPSMSAVMLVAWNKEDGVGGAVVVPRSMIELCFQRTASISGSPVPESSPL